jgi:hypothetical protein
MMSKLSPDQGAATPPLGKATPIAKPDGVKIIAGAGRDAAAKDRADAYRVPRAPERNKQDWRKG